MSSRVVIVDPFESPGIAELADLSGVPWVRVRAWPFEVEAHDRVVTSVPVPSGARGRALGVVTGVPAAAAPDEAWPDLTVMLSENRAEILAHMSGANAPPSPRVGVMGMRGGIGVTYLAACIARTLAHHPLTVALVSDDPHSPLPEWTKSRDAWSQIELDGPILPQRLSETLPMWRRARLMAGRCPAKGVATAVAASLSRFHDVVVEDRGRLTRTADADGLDALVVVYSGERCDLDLWERVSHGIAVPVIAVARTHPTGTVLTPADIADFLGTQVIVFPHEKGARLAPAHGGEPGDRTRGSGAKVAGGIVGQILEYL